MLEDFIVMNDIIIAGRQRKAAKFEMIIAKVTAKLVALWMISWTPYAIVALLGITGHQNFLTPSSLLIYQQLQCQQ